MNLDWILSPITPYAVIALALFACIAFFLSTKSEVHRLRQAADSTQSALTRKIQEVQSVVAEMHQNQAQAEAPAPVPMPGVRPSLNLTRRTQALRMRRRGETAESIAAALSTPRNEIELLFKVYEIVEYRKALKAPAEPAS